MIRTALAIFTCCRSNAIHTTVLRSRLISAPKIDTLNREGIDLGSWMGTLMREVNDASCHCQSHGVRSIACAEFVHHRLHVSLHSIFRDA